MSVYDKEIERDVRKILEFLEWQGVAQFDVIKKGEKYYFLEMNPRFYTSLNVTLKSGLNYPYYLCNPGAEIPKTYKIGVVCKVSIPDTMVYLKQLSKNKYPFYFKAHYDDLDWKDPLPFIPLFVKSIRGKIL